jgi:hypothetical protein
MADPYSQLPGTMVVDGPQQDPWEQAFQQYRQALVDLDGDGVPDAVVPVGDQRPQQAFDPDGRPRVPASGGQNAYPFPTGAYPPNPSMMEQFESNPMGMVLPAFGGAMNMLAATGDAMGPTGMPITMLGRMGAAAARTPGAALGRGPPPQYQLNRLQEQIAPLERAAGRVGSLPPRPMPMPGTPPPQVLDETQNYLAQLQQRAPEVQNRLAARLKEFNEGITAQRPLAITDQYGYRSAALKDGMVRLPDNPRQAGQPAPYIRPEADPARIAAASRETEAISRGNFRMDRQAEAAADLASPTNTRINRDLMVDETMQRFLGSVAQRTGAQPDQLARLPRGQFERFVANEPGLSMLMQQYGMTFDDVIGALATRGYAVPPRAPFNANVMQQYQKGRTGALPMTEAEKALKDAMHARNQGRRGGAGQGGSTFD